jgi:hypothetical protein
MEFGSVAAVGGVLFDKAAAEADGALPLDVVSLDLLGGKELKGSSYLSGLDGGEIVPAWNGQQGLHHGTAFGVDNIGNLEVLGFNFTG